MDKATLTLYAAAINCIKVEDVTEEQIAAITGVDLHVRAAALLCGIDESKVEDKHRTVGKDYCINFIKGYDGTASAGLFDIPEPTRCYKCLDKIGHDDDGYNECRFCNMGGEPLDPANEGVTYVAQAN